MCVCGVFVCVLCVRVRVCVCFQKVLKRLKPLVGNSKRRSLLSKEVLLLHDNARPHSAADTVQVIKAAEI